MTLGEESRRYDPGSSPALSCYTGTGHDGARGTGTRLVISLQLSRCNSVHVLLSGLCSRVRDYGTTPSTH